MKYFIAFTCKDRDGNGVFGLNHRPKSADDIRAIEASIQRELEEQGTKVESVIVTNFIKI